MNRPGFLGVSAGLLAVSAGAASAQAQADRVPGGTQLVERKSDFDAPAFAKIVGREARIRQVWESVAFMPTIFNSVKNALNGLQFGFGYPAGSIAMVFAGHGPSAAYGYDDDIWTKYRIGEFFKLVAPDGGPVTSNVFWAARAPYDPTADPDDPKGSYQDTSIETLQRRGLVVLTCHTAVEEQARAILQKGFAPTGMTATQIADDILTHLIPGAIVVPAMVAAIAVLQAVYRYTYI